jgi:hypothetical protein
MKSERERRSSKPGSRYRQAKKERTVMATTKKPEEKGKHYFTKSEHVFYTDKDRMVGNNRLLPAGIEVFVEMNAHQKTLVRYEDAARENWYAWFDDADISENPLNQL